MPLFFLESAIGQFSGLNAIEIFKKMTPVAEGIHSKPFLN
jgi:hypothetical protein